MSSVTHHVVQGFRSPKMKKNGVVNRLTEVAARILLANVYMTQKKFTEATTVLTPILKLGYLLTQR